MLKTFLLNFDCSICLIEYTSVSRPQRVCVFVPHFFLIELGPTLDSKRILIDVLDDDELSFSLIYLERIGPIKMRIIFGFVIYYLSFNCRFYLLREFNAHTVAIVLSIFYDILGGLPKYIYWISLNQIDIFRKQTVSRDYYIVLCFDWPWVSFIIWRR